MNFEQRFRNVRLAMDERRLNLAVFGIGPDFQYLTGLPVEWRCENGRIGAEHCLFLPREADPILVLSREMETAAETCWIGDIRFVENVSDLGATAAGIGENLALGEGAVAIGAYLQSDACMALVRAFRRAAFESAGTLTSRSRMIKQPEEIDALKRSAELTDEAMRASLEKIKDGITMRQLQLEIEMLGRGMGAESPSFPTVSGFIRSGGGATGSIFGYDLDEGLDKGTTIFFDIGFVVDGYCSDWGRSVYWGRPNGEVGEAYAALQQAVVKTVSGIRPAVTRVCDIFPAIEAALDARGFGHYLRARLHHGVVGHQIGIEVHEDPWLNPENQHTLEPGMVMCFEPKLWRDGDFYLRVEDMVMITETGAESLTSFDRDLFVL
jgi:Xaa-Pro dipeptidase